MDIKVSSTNPKTADTLPVIRVYKDNQLIAEEFINKRNPLKYLRGLKRSKHLRSLERQLMSHGLTLADAGVL